MMTLTEFIADVEGCRLKPYDMEGDIAGVDTIGVGHLLTEEERRSGYLSIGGERVSWMGGITKQQAMNLLSQDLAQFVACVRQNVKTPLSGNQFIALVSFVFNVGCMRFRKSTLLRLLNAGAYDQVPDQLRRWTKNNGRVMVGLKNRREKEIALWNTP